MAGRVEPLRIGEFVVALKEIREVEGVPDLLHAAKGDWGRVIEVRPGYFPTIRFESGTVIDCSPEEIEPVRMPHFLLSGELAHA